MNRYVLITEQEARWLEERRRQLEVDRLVRVLEYTARNPLNTGEDNVDRRTHTKEHHGAGRVAA